MRHTPSLRSCKEGCSVSVVTFDGPDFSCFSVMLDRDSYLSMIALHPFTTSRESILPLWSPSAQEQRRAPDASLTQLFVLLHGMLFTNIQLDDFKRVLERFQEKLEIGGKFGRSLSLLTLTKQTLPL